MEATVEVKLKGIRHEYDFKKAPPRIRRKKHKSGLVILIRMMAKYRQLGKSTQMADSLVHALWN